MAEIDDQGSEETQGERVELTDKARSQLEQFCSAHETQVLTILMSDLEGSTRQQTELGNVRAAELVQEHRTIFRKTLGGFDGQEVETAGDSFLVVFAAPSEGIGFALHMQAAMRQAQEETSELPAVRVGLHQGQVVVQHHETTSKVTDIYGLQVSTAARIMDLGKGGQILCSRAVFDDARAILRGSDLEGLEPIVWCNHGPYKFKGVADAYDVCEVGEEGVAPLTAPPASEKSWPADQEEVPGWRPAVGVVVPESNWTLEERLGKEGSTPQGQPQYRGQFGEVWRARNISDKSEQVFKFCFKREHVPVLKREARLLKSLQKYRHPNLVEVYDVTVGPRPPYYLQMEYVEGPSLEQWLSTDPPIAERLEIVAQVADVLDTVHAAGIFHRDIKPSNILLTHREDGTLQAKLTDFGLGAAEDPELLQSICVSRVEGVAGTWDYVAPELRSGGRASAASDLYSLGLTLFQVITGDLRSVASPGWQELVDSEILRGDIAKCMAADPAGRWRRAGELATALRSHDERLDRLALQREEQRRRERNRRNRVIATVAALLMAVAAAVVIYWWRMPGTLDLHITPPGTRIEIAGQVLTSWDKPLSVRLRAGAYEVRLSLDDHFPETREVVVKRNQAKPLLVTLQHHEGTLDAESEPLGSEIQLNGVPYGSRIRNMRLDTGTYRLEAWADNHFEGRRVFRLGRGRHVKQRFWLERGMGWKYTSPDVQGAAVFVADVDGDSVPDIAHNEINHVVVLSSRTGREAVRLPAAGSGSRSFNKIDLGGNVGQVLAAGMEVHSVGDRPGGLDVFVIRADSPRKFLWRWSGPRRNWKGPQASRVRAVGDLTGDGVSELAVPSRDGRVYILNGGTGTRHKEIAIFDSPVSRMFSVEPLGDEGEARIVYLRRTSDPASDSAEGPWPYVAGCVQLSDGKVVWRKDLGSINGAIVRDVDADGAPELVVWTSGGWRVLAGASGKARGQGTLPKGRRIARYPRMADLDGDGKLEFLVVGSKPSGKLLALRLSDGRPLWEGQSKILAAQPLSRGGLLHRTPKGGLLVAMEDALAVLDPLTGKTVWRVAGRPQGVLVGDWDRDGENEIFVTVRGRGLTCLSAAGRARWTLRTKLDVRPYAMLPDVDGDGLAEILIHRHAALFGLVRGPRILWSQAATGPLQATPLVVGVKGGPSVVIQAGPWSGGELSCLVAGSGAVKWATSCWFPPNRAVAVGDWDSDGKPDVISIGHMPGANEMQLVAFRVADGKGVDLFDLEKFGVHYSHPVAIDLNGDGACDLAIHRWDRQDIVAIDGKSKAIMWRQATGQPNMGGVAVADLSSDGLPDVVAPSMDGYVYALGGTDGKQLWPPAPIGRDGSRSPPLLADVSGDSVPDVLVVGRDGVMYVIDGKTGKSIWRATVPGATEGLGRPAIAKTGGRTIVLASLGSAGVAAFDVAKRAELWRSPRGCSILASPIVADLDGDGLPEVIVGSDRGWVFVLDLASGDVLWRARVSDALIEADPAVVDVNGDGVLDILIAGHDFKLTAISGLGTVGARKQRGDGRRRRRESTSRTRPTQPGNEGRQ